MNARATLVIGIAIGCALGAAGLHFLGHPPAPRAMPPAPSAPMPAPPPVNPVRRAQDQAADDWEQDAHSSDLAAADVVHPGIASTGSVTGTAAGQPPPQRARRADRGQRPPEERYRQFLEYYSNRATSARTAFIAAGASTNDDAVHFDVLVVAMNIRLAEKLDPVMQRYQEGWRPSVEERARILTDVGTIIVGAYDEIDRAMPEGWREAATNDNLNLTHLVNPQYLPLMRGFLSHPRMHGGTRDH